MPKLVPNNNYSLTVDNFSAPKKIRKILSGYCKFIKKKENKLLFTNGKLNFTLWNNHRSCEYYTCYMTLEKNNNYRITKYQLTSNSVYLWISVRAIEPNYLQSHLSNITTLQKFLFLVEFYNKVTIKKNLKRIPTITKIFQDYYIARYISEFL
jgi:hypothetical protein